MPRREDYEFAANLRGDDDGMNINNIDVPRSTLWLAGALYALLSGLITWNLIATLNLKDQRAEDIREIAVAQAKTDGRVESLENRVGNLERQR
jgi:hypothetical protein